MKKRWIAAMCVIAIILLFCGFGFVGLITNNSASGTLSTGRSITAFSDSIYLSTSLQDDTGTIMTAGKVIVVRPKWVEVDGIGIGPIDAESQKIEVHVKRGYVRVIADGKTAIDTSQK